MRERQVMVFMKSILHKNLLLHTNAHFAQLALGSQ